MTDQTTDQQAPHVALVKPEKGAQGFDVGERIILVDGKRWGRTYAHHHSRYGKAYTFRQDHGEVLTEPYDPPSKSGRVHTITVKIGKRQDDNRPMEVQVLEKAEELVRTGKLRDPDIVKQEVDARREQFRMSEEQGKIERRAAWAQKVREALADGPEQDWQPVPDCVVDAIVDLMEWAQSQ